MRSFATYSSASSNEPPNGVAHRLGPPLMNTYVPAHVAINSIVSIVEHFAVRTTAEKLRSALPTEPRVLADVLADATRRIEARWSDRLALWRDWFGINASASADFNRVLAFVDARNAILHGRGSLTRQQLCNDAGRSVISKLASVGIPVNLGRLQIDRNAVALCARSANKAIVWLDDRLAAAGLI